ncbi:hypothetical protein AVEN_267725-1, partial [Araneus ventricosus]
MLISSISPI